MCSSLQQIHGKEIGLLFDGSTREPFLNTDTTDAVLQSSGRSPYFRDARKIVVKIGTILVAMSFKSLGGIPSGPGALCGCKLCKSLVNININGW